MSGGTGAGSVNSPPSPLSLLSRLSHSQPTIFGTSDVIPDGINTPKTATISAGAASYSTDTWVHPSISPPFPAFHVLFSPLGRIILAPFVRS
ncbi:hypothetical protein JMJ77_0014147 [Colletotrichum scovillei]|uniref:Uncharacterized protein n=1 Tax=Colletotrichum scovillei TaxID=1209932 RepID=A0A9P7R2X5_9PEZI|nr:hypothetical protein JMJ77_0014147 [Colletotrichum scovillei]KAG7065671.1 hypothetical protein JMJ78_0012418 [Colletotrichum scovillei]KAG7068274.1 hypothetical protein JMJ76_0007964 [Colletotrichum scovillei]